MYLKQTYNNQICPNVLDTLGYISRILCAISVGVVVYFGLEVFANSFINANISEAKTSNLINFISFIVGYYSELTIKKLKKVLEKEEEVK
jgi:hypothetical protein